MAKRRMRRNGSKGVITAYYKSGDKPYSRTASLAQILHTLKIHKNQIKSLDGAVVFPPSFKKDAYDIFAIKIEYQK